MGNHNSTPCQGNLLVNILQRERRSASKTHGVSLLGCRNRNFPGIGRGPGLLLCWAHANDGNGNGNYIIQESQSSSRTLCFGNRLFPVLILLRNQVSSPLDSNTETCRQEGFIPFHVLCQHKRHIRAPHVSLCFGPHPVLPVGQSHEQATKLLRVVHT
jgi:hypothetical protein